MNQEFICQEELLTLYHFDELSAAQRALLERHLQDCQDCQTALDELRLALTAVPLRKVQLDPGQRERFIDQVTSRTRRRSLPGPKVWGGILSAAGALALVVVLLGPDGKVVPPATSGPELADYEILEQLDMLQELDLLQDFELLEELEQLG